MLCETLHVYLATVSEYPILAPPDLALFPIKGLKTTAVAGICAHRVRTWTMLADRETMPARGTSISNSMPIGATACLCLISTGTAAKWSAQA